MTPTQLKVIERSRRFREAIEQKAADLADRRRPQPSSAPVSPPPVKHFAVEPQSDMLPPIPNEDIAAAADIAFPTFVPEVRRIQLAIVAEFPSISLIDLLSPRRTEPLVTARQIAMYLAKEITAQSFPAIGRRFGGRDHTTVLHAVRKIRRLITTDAKLAERVARVRQSLTESAL